MSEGVETLYAIDTQNVEGRCMGLWWGRSEGLATPGSLRFRVSIKLSESMRKKFGTNRRSVL